MRQTCAGWASSGRQDNESRLLCESQGVSISRRTPEGWIPKPDSPVHRSESSRRRWPVIPVASLRNVTENSALGVTRHQRHFRYSTGIRQRCSGRGVDQLVGHDSSPPLQRTQVRSTETIRFRLLQPAPVMPPRWRPDLPATSPARRTTHLRRDPSAFARCAALSPGDPLQARMGADRWELLDRSGTVVGQLARGFRVPAGVRCAFATVMAIVEWDRERSDPDYWDGLRCDSWEVVVPEIVFEPDD